jgi:hypothetical protein
LLKIYARVPWAKLLKKDIINNHKIIFNEDMRIGEDTEFILQYLSNCKSVQILSNINYQHGVIEEKAFVSKYALSFNEFDKHYHFLESAIIKMEKQNNRTYSSIREFLEQIFTGLFLKNLLVNVSLYSYLKERKKYISKYSKKYSIRVFYMSNFCWKMFLYSGFSAFLFYCVYKIKRDFFDKEYIIS